MINLKELKEKILEVLGNGIKELHVLQSQLENRYHVAPLQYWQAVKEVAQEQAKKTKDFVDSYPNKEEIFLPAIRVAMDYLTEIFDHAEKLIVAYSAGDRNKN